MMRKFILGSIFTLLINYCIGATFIIIKGSDKNVRANRTNVNSVN